MSSSNWPPVAELLPHTGQAILIHRVVSHTPDETSVEVIAGHQPALQRPDGSVPSFIAVEFMAQGIAAHEGLLEWTEGRAMPIGFLISVRGTKFHVPAFEAGEVLRVSARRVRGRAGLGVLSHECAVFRGQNEDAVATGLLAIALAQDAKSLV